jgi:uncharacterized protein YggE
MKMLRISVSFLAVLILAGLQAGVAQTITVGKDNRTLEVSGVGTASAEPDVAKVHVGFSTYGATLPDAYKNTSDMSNAIVKALVGAGAAKTDIESQSQSVQALSEYELKNLPSSLKGMKYRAGQTWTVRVEPKNVAKTIDVAVQAGANRTGQVDWLMKDSTQLERDAVSLATVRTRALAAEMSSGLNVKLGPLLYATTEIQPPIGLMRNAMAYSAQVEVNATPPLAIEAQRVERSVTVRAVFAIE